MRPFLHGFADELVKLGAAVPLTRRTDMGPIKPVGVRTQPQGYGGGQTPYKPVQKQQFGVAKPKKTREEYIPVGTQKFKPQAAKAVAAPIKKPRRRKAKAAVDSPRYETGAMQEDRLAQNSRSRRRMKEQGEQKWLKSVQKSGTNERARAKRAVSAKVKGSVDRMMGRAGPSEDQIRTKQRAFRVSQAEKAENSRLTRSERGEVATKKRRKARNTLDTRLKRNPMHSFATSGGGKM